MQTNVGNFLILCGWIWMITGITSGSIIGLYAFSGPFKSPKNHENYDSLPRRLVRLAHIAMFMLPLITIVYGMHIDQVSLTLEMKNLAANSMLTCMIGIPLFLVLASFKIAFKYFEVIPVTAGFIAFSLMAYGQYCLYVGSIN